MRHRMSLTLALVLVLGLAFPAWSIEKTKKTEPTKAEERPQVSETEKKARSPVEIAPPKEQRPEETKRSEPTPEERAKEKEKIKLPPIERKLIEQVDRFVDKNGNGIDDRLEGSQRQPEKPKPVEKKKRR